MLQQQSGQTLAAAAAACLLLLLLLLLLLVAIASGLHEWCHCRQQAELGSTRSLLTLQAVCEPTTPLKKRVVLWGVFWMKSADMVSAEECGTRIEYLSQQSQYKMVTS